MCDWKKPKYWMRYLNDFELALFASGRGNISDLKFRTEADIAKIKTGQISLKDLAKDEIKRRS